MLTIADMRDFLSKEVITEEMNFSSSRRKYIASLCPDINIGLDLYEAVDITRRGDFNFIITPRKGNVSPRHNVVEVTYNFNLDRYVVIYNPKIYTDYNDFIPALVFAVVQMLSDHREG